MSEIPSTNSPTPAPSAPWALGLLGHTGGRIAALLAGGERTVGELGELLALTPNAVRMQLTRLERDGVVEQAGQRDGIRKPHILYRLSPRADQLFPKAYSLVLHHLLGAISKEKPDDARHLLEEVGRRIAAAHPAPRDPRERISFAMNLLAELGAVAELRHDEEGHLVIQGQRCPLSDVVPDHPELCRALATLLEQLLGEPVSECCDRHTPPACRFVVGAD